jgi:hypothetical protein
MLRKLTLALFLMVLSVMIIGVTAQPAAAQGQTPTMTGEYMNVSSLVPFSPEANFMSLAGYLRWTTLRDQQVLLTRAEAQRIVTSQLG